MTNQARTWFIWATVDGEEHVYLCWHISEGAAVDAVVARLTDEGRESVAITRTSLSTSTSTYYKHGSIVRLYES